MLMTRENFISICRELIACNCKLAKYFGEESQEAESLYQENDYLKYVISALEKEDFVFDDTEEPCAGGFFLDDGDFDDDFDEDYDDSEYYLGKEEHHHGHPLVAYCSCDCLSPYSDDAGAVEIIA